MSVMEWPTPKDVYDIRYFMGLAGYYRRFIKGFSKIGCPIIALQKKGIKFIWTSKCEERFKELKYLLTHAPMLKIVDPDNDFLVCIDVCKEGLGGVLMQEGHVIYYTSFLHKNSSESFLAGICTHKEIIIQVCNL